MEQVNIDRLKSLATVALAVGIIVLGFMLPDGPITFFAPLPDTIAIKWFAYCFGGAGFVLAAIGFIIAGYERK